MTHLNLTFAAFVAPLKLLAFAVVLISTPAARSQVVGPFQSILEVRTTNGPDELIGAVGPDEFTSLGHAITPQGALVDVRAIGQTKDGYLPTAAAGVLATSTGVLQDNGFYAGVSGTGYSSTLLRYSVRIPVPGPLPGNMSIPVLPIIATVNGYARALATPGEFPAGNRSGTFAVTAANVGGTHMLIAEAMAPVNCSGCESSGEEEQVTFDFKMNFAPGQVVGVLLQAIARGVAETAGELGYSKVEAVAVVDPVFRFDQEAFDEMARTQGFETFNLSDYFTFEFSPGVTNLPDPPGDYNASGMVEQADLDLVLLNWGQTFPSLAMLSWVNDLPEGPVDQDELDGVLLNWGSAADGGIAVGVPEPSALWIAGVIAIAMAFQAVSHRARSI